MSSTFESAYISMLVSRLNDSDITVAWAQTPEGAPIPGKTDVVCYYAPGGEKQDTHSGMSGEESRRIQFSIFSVDPQDVKDVSAALHTIVDGARGTLSDGTKVFNTVPGIQDIDSYDNEEKVHQTVFDVEIHIGLEAGGISDLDEPLTENTKTYIDTQDAAILAEAEAYTDAHAGASAWDDITGKPATFPPSSHTHPESDVVNLVTDLAAKEATANKDQANGYPSLDSGGKIPTTEMPVPFAFNTDAVSSLDAFTLSDAGATAVFNSIVLKSALSIVNNLRKALNVYYQGDCHQGNNKEYYGIQSNCFALLDALSGSSSRIVALGGQVGFKGTGPVPAGTQANGVMVQVRADGTTGGALQSFIAYNPQNTNGALPDSQMAFNADYAAITASPATITNISISGNVVTVTCANAFAVGLSVRLRDLTVATFLNGVGLTILTRTPGQFTATYVHADYASAVDTGTASSYVVGFLIRIGAGGYGLDIDAPAGNNVGTGPLCHSSGNILSGGVRRDGWYSGNGSPEGVVQAVVGSFYSRLDGGAGTSIYYKESGSGKTGWVARGADLITAEAYTDSAVATEAAARIAADALKAPLASPALTGTPTAPTPTTGDDSTKIATTAFVEDTIDNLVAGDIPNLAESQVTNLVSDLALKAPLASPALTGSPTAPTQSAGDNSTKIATTAYADGAVATEASARSTADELRQLLSEKDANSGYAGLTSGGLLKAAEFPTPTTSLFGGVKDVAAVATKVVNAITNGVAQLVQLAFSDISGTIAGSQLPAPSSSVFGGVKALAAVATKFLTSIGTDGIPVAAQPAFTDISGTVAGSQLPTPTTSVFGGVKDLAAVATKFLTSIVNGVPVAAQPAFTDISGQASLTTQVSGVLPPANGGVANLVTSGSEFLIGPNFPPAGAAIVGGQLVGSAQQVRAVKFVLPYQITITKVIYRASTGVGGSTITIGIYDKAGTTKLLDSGTFDGNVTTAQTKTIGSVTLAPGTYWFAWSASTQTTLQGPCVAISTAWTDTCAQGLSGGPISGNAANAASAGVLPSSLGVITSAANNVAAAVFTP